MLVNLVENQTEIYIILSQKKVGLKLYLMVLSTIELPDLKNKDLIVWLENI
jgi:hypothetical protein